MRSSWLFRASQDQEHGAAVPFLLRERLSVLQAQLEGHAKHRKVVSNTHAFYETRRHEVLNLIELTTHDLEDLMAELDGPELKPEKEISVHSRSSDVGKRPV